MQGYATGRNTLQSIARRRSIRASAQSSQQRSGEIAGTASLKEGEWLGVSSAFSADGKLQPVPERFVPPDFAQWGQSVNAWSTCTSYKQEEGELMIRTKYMLPTVGCEADASSFEEDMRTFAASEVGTCGGHNGDGVFALCPDRLPAAAGTAVLEVSFQEGDTRRRVRFTLQRYLEEKPFKVNKIEVFREEYAGPYTGGRELPSSCGAEPGFGEDERCAEEAALEHIQASMLQTDQDARELFGKGLVRLPLGLWAWHGAGISGLDDAGAADVQIICGTATSGASQLSPAWCQYTNGKRTKLGCGQIAGPA